MFNTTTKGGSTGNSSPHWFETAIGDARLWGVAAVIGLAIAFSRRSANSDLAVWGLLIVAAGFVVMIVNTHRWIRASERRFVSSIVAIIFITPTAIAMGVWLTTPAEAPQQPFVHTMMEWLIRIANMPWRTIMPSLAIGALIAGASAVVILRRDRLIRQRRLMAEHLAESLAPKVEILSPLTKWRVGWRRTVRGSVFPPDSVVQVLVQFPDDWWYVQGPVDVIGRAWTCQCEFGVASRTGHIYEVVAMHGTSLKAEKYEHLPENVVRSSVVRVHRDSNDDDIDCPDKRLHETKINDKWAIKDMVKVYGINCEVDLEGDEPHVSFVLCFVNLCLFPVSVESVTGFITYQKDGCDQTVGFEYPPKLMDNDHARGRGFRDAGGWLRIRQNLAPWEIARTQNGSKESVFYFHKLDIWMTGEGFEPVRLDADRVQKGISWVARNMSNECDYVYANIEETKAKIGKLEAERDVLQSQLDKGA